MGIYGNNLSYIKEDLYLYEFENEIFNEGIGDILGKIKEGIKKVILKLLEAIEGFLNKHKGNKVCDKIRPLIGKWKSKLSTVEKTESKEELQEVQQEIKKDQEAIALASNDITEEELKEFSSIFGDIQKGDSANKHFEKFKQFVKGANDDEAKMKKAIAYIRIKSHGTNADYEEYRNFIKDRDLTDKQRIRANKKRDKLANKEQIKNTKEKIKEMKKQNKENMKDKELAKELKQQRKEDKKYGKEVARKIKNTEKIRNRATRSYFAKKKRQARFNEADNIIEYNLAFVEEEMDIIEEGLELI